MCIRDSLSKDTPVPPCIQPFQLTQAWTMQILVHQTPPLLEACTKERISAAATVVGCYSAPSPLDASTRLVMKTEWTVPAKVVPHLLLLVRRKASKRKSVHSRWSSTPHLAVRLPRPQRAR